PLMRTAVTPGRPPARLREGVDHVHGRTAGTGRVGRGQVCGAARAGSLSSAVGRVSRPLLLRAPRKESTVWESRTRSSAKPGVTDPLTLFLFEDLVPVVTFDAEDDHRYTITGARPLLLICGGRGRRFRSDGHIIRRIL